MLRLISLSSTKKIVLSPQMSIFSLEDTTRQTDYPLQIFRVWRPLKTPNAFVRSYIKIGKVCIRKTPDINCPMRSEYLN